MYKEEGSSPMQMVKTLFSGWVGVGETEEVGVLGVLAAGFTRLQDVTSNDTINIPSPSWKYLIRLIK